MVAVLPGKPSGIAALLACVALLTFTWAVNHRALDLRPLSGDNLYILNWAERAPASTILAGDPDFYPEWRPLPYLTVWLQYRWLGLDGVSFFYMENLLLWAACAWLAWRLVAGATGSNLAGYLAGALLVADARTAPAVAWIIERQTSMACALGLLAWLVYARDPRRNDWPRVVGVSVLLFASALSKEYGLAFAGALFLWAWLDRRPAFSIAAAVALVEYVVLRFSAAGGASAGTFCEESGYFFALRTVCYGSFNSIAVTQMAYNVGAAGLDSLLPGLLRGDGQITVAPVRLLTSAIWLGFAGLGWRQGSAIVRAAAAAIALSAVLNFTHYRDRNHLVSLCAFSLTAAIGWEVALVWIRGRFSAWGGAALVLVTTCVLGVSAIQATRVMDSVVTQLLAGEPCETFADIPHLDPSLVRRVKQRYGMPNQECAGVRP